MSRRVFKRPQAERDIEECFVFIAEDNLDTGVYFLVAVEDSLEQFAKFPLIGKQSEFQNRQFPNMRMWHVKGYENYLIFLSWSKRGLKSSVSCTLHATSKMFSANQPLSKKNHECYNIFERLNNSSANFMAKTTYEPIEENLDRPATKADVERILMTIEILSWHINAG